MKVKKFRGVPQILRTCAALVAAHLPSLTARAEYTCRGCKCGEEPVTSVKDSKALVSSLESLIRRYKSTQCELETRLKAFPNYSYGLRILWLKDTIKDLEQLL